MAESTLYLRINVSRHDYTHTYAAYCYNFITPSFLASPNVNNVSVISDYTLSNGIEIFVISEVLFVSEAVVSRLHQVFNDIEMRLNA